MQWCTPMILSFTLSWDKAILLQHYRILRLVSKISCPALRCLNVTQRRLKSFTSPRFFHRPNQFLLLRLEIVQCLWVMKSKTLGSHLTAISLLKLTSATFVAPPHLLFITSEKLGTFYVDLLRSVLFTHFSLQNWIVQQHSSRPSFLRAREFTTLAKYSRKANC